MGLGGRAVSLQVEDGAWGGEGEAAHWWEQAGLPVQGSWMEGLT